MPMRKQPYKKTAIVDALISKKLKKGSSTEPNKLAKLKQMILKKTKK
jgi:hypothetical protein